MAKNAKMQENRIPSYNFWSEDIESFSILKIFGRFFFAVFIFSNPVLTSVCAHKALDPNPLFVVSQFQFCGPLLTPAFAKFGAEPIKKKLSTFVCSGVSRSPVTANLTAQGGFVIVIVIWDCDRNAFSQILNPHDAFNTFFLEEGEMLWQTTSATACFINHWQIHRQHVL